MDEILDVVDDQDNVIGQEKKCNKPSLGFRSRNVAIYIFDKDKKLIVAKRAPDRKICPNFYDVVAGNVGAGESYEQAAIREVKEEFGITCNLKFFRKYLNNFLDQGNEYKYFTTVFIGFHEGDITLNNEFTESKAVSIEEMLELLKQANHNFTPPLAQEFVKSKQEFLSAVFG